MNENWVNPSMKHKFANIVLFQASCGDKEDNSAMHQHTVSKLNTPFPTMPGNSFSIAGKYSDKEDNAEAYLLKHHHRWGQRQRSVECCKPKPRTFSCERRATSEA